MFWNKKTSAEQRKEIRLNVLQLEKLIERAINNANKAIVAFNMSIKTRYSNDSQHELSRKISTAADFMSAVRFTDQNEQVLSEIEAVFDSKRIKVPIILQEGLKNAINKNRSISAKLSVADEALLRVKDKDPELFLVIELELNQGSKAGLLDAMSSLSDFQELFHQHFSISKFNYIHEDRLDELRIMENSDFDLSKLIRLCEELNSAFQNANYLTVAMLVRTILDHVPPIFGFRTFVEVSSNYGGKSLKKSLQNLQNSSRNIADAHLHEPIRRKESLPNETQIDFRNDLDVLLGEIVRILK